ncbi:MAG: hypothetical protein ACRDQD_04185 [Nocardioidaceae bacterium]
MIVVAFDLSLTSTGVARADGTTARITSKLTGPARLVELREAVLLATSVPWAHLVVLEGLAYGVVRGNGAHHSELAGLHAIVRVALWEREVPVVEIPPASLKMVATGKGNASKEEVHEAAIRRLGFTGANRDEADALWLWTAAQIHYGLSTIELPATHRRGLDKVRWPTMEPLHSSR